MATMTLGFGLFIDLDVNASWAKIVVFQAVAGLGVGPNFQSPLIALQTLVSPKDNATATSTFVFIRNFASALSVVLGGVIFQNCMESQFVQLRAELGSTTAAQLSGGSASSNAVVLETLRSVQREVARTAFVYSLKMMWILYASVAAIGAVASAFIGKQTLSQQYEETKTGLDNEYS
jgi:hypothetical protein